MMMMTTMMMMTMMTTTTTTTMMMMMMMMVVVVVVVILVLMTADQDYDYVIPILQTFPLSGGCARVTCFRNFQSVNLFVVSFCLLGGLKFSFVTEICNLATSTWLQLMTSDVS